MSRRVLIVNASVMVRHALVELIEGEAGLELVGSASCGNFALGKISTANPDTVLVDVDPPNASTLELIAQIRQRHPAISVVVCSSNTDRMVRRRVLAAGAADFITRPELAIWRASKQRAMQSLLDALRRGGAPVRASLPPSELRAIRPGGTPEVCVVGASTGGPNALSAMFQQMPRPEVPIVIVQHMPPQFTAQLAKRLTNEGEIPFVEAQHGMRAEPRCGYVAPGDYHVLLARDAKGLFLELSQAAPENSVRPAVDVLFASAAEVCGGRVVAVVLTGMGHDGLRGCAAIRAVGGHVVVQDEASSVVWGMPGSVATAGHAHSILPLSEITPELTRRLPLAQFARRHA